MNNIFSIVTLNKLPFKLFTVLIVILFLGLSEIVYAEEITYTGDGENLRGTPPYFYKYSSGLQFPGSLFAGTASVPLSSGNKVTVDYNPEGAEAINPQLVFGGLSETVQVANNSVTVRNGHVGDVFGGYSHRGDVADNVVTINGGSIAGNVYGGESAVKNVAGNTVTVTGGLVAKKLFGGYGENGIVSDNMVTMSGGSVDRDVFGGQSRDGDAMNNTVTISCDVVSENVFGGASGNGSAAGNKVFINSGYVGMYINGGWSDRGDTADNTVTINGGSVREGVSGGVGLNGSATGNTVTISGGSVDGGIIGGMGGENVTHNTVIVSGGSVGEGVLGGYSANGAATDNTVTINGKPDVAKASIYGGYTTHGGGNNIAGNTLNCNSSGISAIAVDNFEYYNFYLPKDLKPGRVMLSVTEQINLNGTTVEVFSQDGAKLRKGGKVALIKSAKGINGSPKNKLCQVNHDGALYEFSIYTDKNNLWAEVTKLSSPAK